MTDRNLSHQNDRNSLEGIKKKIINRKDLPYASVSEQLGILDLVSQTPLGQFLIERGGLNGYWTQYVVDYPNLAKKAENPVETFLLEKAPTTLATQQRFLIFKEEIQKCVKKGVVMASIPCGLMAELLDLKYDTNEFRLVGIDIDQESLDHAKDYASSKGLEGHCQFQLGDAWNLQIDAEFDLIASNGLSIYEDSDEKVVDLFREFFKALKSGGTLITSFLTPPSDWDVAHVVQTDALMQKLVFADILDCKWQTFRSSKQTIEQLQRAGFSSIEVKRDKAFIFPTIIAHKA